MRVVEIDLGDGASKRSVTRGTQRAASVLRALAITDFAVFDWRVEVSSPMVWELEQVMTVLPLPSPCLTSCPVSH